MAKQNIKVGDTIVFTTIDRDGKHKAKRKVVEISDQFGVGVRFNGHCPYWLFSKKLDKIISVIKPSEA